MWQLRKTPKKMFNNQMIILKLIKKNSNKIQINLVNLISIFLLEILNCYLNCIYNITTIINKRRQSIIIIVVRKRVKRRRN